MTKESRAEAARPNPALKQLEVFVGEWDIEISRATWLPDMQAKVSGHSRFEWIENGAFLAMYQNLGTIRDTWLIGRDESNDSYEAFFFDDRKRSRIYEMSYKAGVWRIWRSTPTFYQRSKGVLNKSHNRISSEWKSSKDGRRWGHDFNVEYTKIK